MASLQQLLLEWYDAHKRDLPWRRTRDPYAVWVSEVMLQQTRVATVVPYFERFLREYPDVRSLAAAPLEKILKSWEGLGYYARARNLHRAAGIVAREMNGEIPGDYDAFRALPGAGDYIAAAVMSIAFGLPFAAVDGNFRRVLARLFLIGAAPTARIFRERAKEIIEPSRPGDSNQAVMELGALVCGPRQPDCPRCPVSGCCLAFAGSLQRAYPAPRERRPVPEYRVAVGVVRKGGRILITRRPEDGLLGGLWELPGGKIRPGESPEDACRREIAEEVGLAVRVNGRVARVGHAYTHFRVDIEVFDCEYVAGDVRLRAATDHRWILLEETARYAFPAANHKIFPHLSADGREAHREDS